MRRQTNNRTGIPSSSATIPSVIGPMRPEREPARVVGVGQVPHVPDDRIHLVIGERVGTEHRHLPGAGAHRLGDLERGRRPERWARRRRSSARRRCRWRCGTRRSSAGTACRPRRGRRRAGSTSGIGGPSPSDATYATSASISPASNAGGLRTGCALGSVERHAAGRELEVGGGGAHADQATVRRPVPPPSAPWQLEHDVRNSCAAALDLGADRRPPPPAARSVPEPPTAAAANTTTAGRQTTSRIARRRTRSRRYRSTNMRQEQEDPHDVDEVPVVADRLDGGRPSLERSRRRW